MILDSRRARGAPKQKWIPLPNPTWGLGSRSMRNSSGFSNWRSSWFAECSQTMSISCESITCPPSWTLVVVTRPV